MITVNVLYPNRDGARFDMDYYLASHIPMLRRELGSALKGCTVERGIGDGAEFAVLCHLRFDSVEAYEQAMGPVGEQVRDDVARYSSEPPIIQLSEVVVAA